MHWTRTSHGWILILILISLACALPARAQFAQVSGKLLITASSASHGADGSTDVLQLSGPVTITADDLTCSADKAVIWLIPIPGPESGEQQADIALIGHATVSESLNHVTRSGPKLLVSLLVRGMVQLSAPSQMRAGNLAQSPLYLDAQAMRQADPESSAPVASAATVRPPPQGGTSVLGVIQPSTSSSNKAGFVEYHAALVTPITADDGTRALELSGGASITETGDNGDFLELRARNVVLFSSQRPGSADLATSGGGRHFTAAYLEGDVRMDYTPAAAKKPEQRLTADRIYYDFVTQRAILTNVVFHSIDPKTQFPITFRAQVMRQLTHDEYTMRHAEFSISKFAVPTFSVRATYAYVRQEPDNPGTYDVSSRNITPNLYGIPLFYWPVLWGTLNDKPFPLRNFNTGNSSIYGFTLDTEWGLFETLGESPPKGLDISYLLNYFSDRGFGGGINGKYQGGFITDSDQPWEYQGDFKSFIMNDKGIDNLGGLRDLLKPPSEIRGRFLWEHQQLLPDNWQVQIRLGYVSDPTFLEEYYSPEFNTTLPYDAEFYVKQQEDTEALTFLAETDTTRFTTNSDRQQEQFDVARLPELSYQRIGDSFADDHLTLYSDNSAAGLKFDPSAYSLAEQGFGPGLSPGLPSDGFTGTTNQLIFRGDTRQEVDWPFSISQFRLVPFAMGEVTEYSNSPDGDEETRLYGGVGLRLTTTFWRTFDNIDSDLLDIHRLRHVIQPEVNIFTYGTTVPDTQLYDFDPNVDAINDITGAQFALHQHWDTMRGGPGRWQSVDILDFDVEADLYTHAPPPSFLNPISFRGLFFPSEPQTSVARDAINSDLTWHLSDDAAVLADVQWNADQKELAVAEAGVNINRGGRLSYYFGDAYVQALNSQILSFNANYNISEKYQFSIAEALDFSSSRAEVTMFVFTRRFDVATFSIAVYHDGIANVNGVNVNFYPIGQPGYSTPWHVND